MKMSNIIIIAVVALLVGGGGGFYGGLTYQKSKQPSAPGGFGARTGAFANGNFARGNGNFARGAGGNAVRGSVTAIDGMTVTVKETNGSTKLVLIGSSTTVSKSTNVNVSDVKVGDTVAAFGTANSDGSVTATSFQLNPTAVIGGPEGGTPPAN